MRRQSATLILVLLFNCVTQAQLPHEIYLPSEASNNNKVPLVVLLHGCGQTAQDIIELSRMRALAEVEQFALLAPEQSPISNPKLCWNWFLQVNQSRLGFEALKIASKVRLAIKDLPILPEQVFVAGLSAGGAMAGLMGYHYHDLFTAVAIHSGASFLRAQTLSQALDLLKYGPDRKTQTEPCDQHRRPLLVIQGLADDIVHPTNAQALIDDLGACDATKNKMYIDPTLPHAWSGGAPEKKYSYPSGEDASQMIWSFFKEST